MSDREVAMAQLSSHLASSQLAALPKAELRTAPGLRAPGISAWMPLASVLAGIICIFYVAQTSELTTTGYNIQELRTEESSWRLKNEQLMLEVARARSLAVVEKDATERLLMVRPKDAVYLRVQVEDIDRRASASSRGEPRNERDADETAALKEGDLLSPIQASISSLLAPRTHLSRR